MNLVDWVLIGCLIVFAWAGWRQGFVAGALSFAGFLGGGLLAAFFLPGFVASHLEPGLRSALVVGFGILVAAILGQVVLSILGRSLRRAIHWTPVKFVDKFLGVALNVLALAIITWVIANAVA